MRAALENLSRIERRPVNQLLNGAVRSYLLRRGPRERSLEASLGRLRAYRERDPTFPAARRALVEAEARVADPVGGTAVDGLREEGRPARAGSARRKLRGMLGAKLGRGLRPSAPEPARRSWRGGSATSLRAALPLPPESAGALGVSTPVEHSPLRRSKSHPPRTPQRRLAEAPAGAEPSAAWRRVLGGAEAGASASFGSAWREGTRPALRRSLSR